jgi:hypothetical protein
LNLKKTSWRAQKDSNLQPPGSRFEPANLTFDLINYSAATPVAKCTTQQDLSAPTPAKLRQVPSVSNLKASRRTFPTLEEP